MLKRRIHIHEEGKSKAVDVMRIGGVVAGACTHDGTIASFANPLNLSAIGRRSIFFNPSIY
jgi:hypothetical protein